MHKMHIEDIKAKLMDPTIDVRQDVLKDCLSNYLHLSGLPCVRTFLSTE